MKRKFAVNGVGFLGLWSVLSACSGSTTQLNKEPLQDGGGNAPSAGGSVGEGGSTGGGANATGGAGGAGGSELDAAAGGNVAVGGAGGVVNAGTGGDPFATGGAPTGVTTSKKLDVLIMVDNSTSMSDKQKPLAATVSDLVKGLASVQDLHIGVITSSLGGHGASTCEEQPGATPSQLEQMNDHAHLLGTRPRAASLNLPNGFVSWTPAAGIDALTSQVQGLVQAAGQEGCGLESQLEAIYRFLADPFPPQSIVLAPCNNGNQCATPQGIDSEILTERKAFLRPDSALAVVMLTDENDCSIRDYDQYYYAATLSVFLPQAATICGTNPNDPCCYSCGLPPPQGCAPDPTCASHPSLNQSTDTPDQRCFDQKRRFGIDFLYPVSRYVNALRNPTLCTTAPNLVAPAGGCPARADSSPGEAPNPIYTNASGGPVRDRSMVYLLGIVGVPWQDLAQAPADQTALDYFTPRQLRDNGTWAKILGDSNPGPVTGPVLATDPHMRESVDPRPGLPGPSTAPTSDPISGHDWANLERVYIQYACIFDLPAGQVHTCTSGANCDCYNLPPGDNNPLCADPSGNYGDVQYKAKAYPGLRELSVIQALGPNGIPASICARNLVDNNSSDFGYRPAVGALATAMQGNVQ